MKKLIFIGECALDVIYENGVPVGSMPGGRLLNAAAMLGRCGATVALVGDTGNDPLGDILVNFLRDANVDITSVDRYTDGLTAVNFYFAGDRVVSYETGRAEGFDVVWPRIERGDVVVYGGYHAIDPANHRRVSQLVAHAVEMRAVVVYMPGFMPCRVPRLTRVMPSILENMETASLVLVRPADLQAIYGTDDAEAAFRDHVAYYAKAMVSIDAKAREIVGYTLSGATRHPLPELDDSLLSQSAAVGAVAEAIVSGYPAQSDNLSPAELESIVKRATDIQPMVYGASEYPGWQMKH